MRAAVIQESRYQYASMELDDDTVMIRLLGERNEIVFEKIFKTHFRNLHAYACTIVKDEVMAEEMVQNVFYKIWDRSEQVHISGSIPAYLYRAVYNESLNYLKHLKVRSAFQSYASHSVKEPDNNAAGKLLHSELSKNLHRALGELPEQCRTIFQMSRFEDLRYREIAERLGISIKTVENQMSKALNLLRTKLVDFLPLVLIVLNLK